MSPPPPLVRHSPPPPPRPLPPRPPVPVLPPPVRSPPPPPSASTYWAGWADAPVGVEQVPGSATYGAPGALTVLGSGYDIWFSQDGCHYAYKLVSGDVRGEGQVMSITTANRPDSRPCCYVSARISGCTGLWLGGLLLEKCHKWSNLLPIRSAYHHPQPILRLGKSTLTMDLATSFHAGIAITSHDNTALVKGTLLNVNVSPLL
eukprot:jgi/Chlat1/3422/Chrsp23S03818